MAYIRRVIPQCWKDGYRSAQTGGLVHFLVEGDQEMKTTKLASVVAILAALCFSGKAFAQTDPGVRNNTGVNAGQPLASVTANANDLLFFPNRTRAVQRAPNRYGRQPRAWTTVQLGLMRGVSFATGPGELARLRNLPHCGADPQSQGHRQRGRKMAAPTHRILRPGQWPGARSTLPVLL